MKKRTGLLLAVLLALIGYGAGLAQPYVFRAPLVVGQDAVVPHTSARARVTEAGGRTLVVEPAQGAVTVAFVLYPGGLVRPQAYEWIGHALSVYGVRTLSPEMPLDLAVLDSGRAANLGELTAGLPVVVGGHSLGGAMAASYAAGHTDQVAGLVLLAAYPSDSTSLVDAPFPAVSLLAANDEVTDAAKVRGGLGRLPADTRLVTVDGAVHSFFGRYGPQAGDGVPTVMRAEAEGAIATELLRFFERWR